MSVVCRVTHYKDGFFREERDREDRYISVRSLFKLNVRFGRALYCDVRYI